MRVSIKLPLPISAALFGLLFVPMAALAGAANCPVEPAQGVPIASGDVYAGTNCVLNTPGDVDSFQFRANKGDTYRLAAAEVNEVCNQDIGLTLYDPNQVQVFVGYSNSCGGGYSVVTDQALTTSGLYTMVVTEAGSAGGTRTYGVSLERLHPVPPDAQQLTLPQSVAGTIAPLTDSNAFTFVGAATSTYRATGTMTPGGCHNDLCLRAYYPDGTLAASQCTNSCSSQYTAQVDFNPPKDGTNMVLVYEAGYNNTFNYNLEVSCVVGCRPVPSCDLKDNANYDATSSTLTMDFTVGNTYATTWNAWLTYQNAMVPLFSIAQPITSPPAAITKTFSNLNAEGKVGVLSTLTTPKKGIACSSWVQIETGAP
jgi:hypothetical protein